MDNIKTDEYYISKVIEHLENIIEYLDDVDEQHLKQQTFMFCSMF